MKPIKGLVLRKDTNTWWIDTVINGRRIRRSLGLPKECRKEAKEAIHLFWLEVAKGNLGLTQKDPPLELLFDKYIEYRLTETNPEWCKFLQKQFYRLESELGFIKLSDFDPGKFFTWLFNLPTRNTARKLQMAVNAAFDHAVMLELIDQSPTRKLKRLSHTYKEKEPLSLTDFSTFAEAASNYGCGYLLRFLMKTGCRFSEAALATWQRMDLKSRVFILRYKDTKTSKRRDVGLADDVVAMLRYIRPKNAKPNDLVFPSAAGTSFSVYNTRRVVKTIGKKMGVPELTTHALRTTFSTLVRELEDVSLEELGKVLGHTSESTTQIYAHETPLRQSRIAEKLPKVFPLSNEFRLIKKAV